MRPRTDVNEWLTLAAPHGRIVLTRLTPLDLIALTGAAVLVGSLFLSWYQTDPSVPAAQVEHRTGGVSGWDTHPFLRFLLLATAFGALLSAWQTVRGAEHVARPGEGVGFLAIAAAFLIFYFGLVDRPGGPSGTIHLELGWFLALPASLAIVATALVRIGSTYRREPPGV